MAEEALTIELKMRPRDYARVGLKVALSSLPVAGPFISEIVNEIIPGDRIDRIADFCAMLDERINGIEVNLLTGVLGDPEFVDLAEEALRQAARAISKERRTYLVELVATSLSIEKLEYLQSKHLMRILDELSDIEVLWLKWFHLCSTRDNTALFEDLHKNSLDFRIPTLGSTDSEKDTHAITQSYILHLERCGLIEDQARQPIAGEDRALADRLTRARKALPSRGKKISQLGILMLRSIGISA